MSVETRVLLLKTVEGPSKKRRGSKKDAQLSPLKVISVEKVAMSLKKVVEGEQSSKKSSKPVDKATVIPSKEMVPSKLGVLKIFKKMAHKPHHSPKRSTSFSPSFVRKPQIGWKGVVIHEIPTPVSPQ